ncbi:MAG: PEP-CTERM sorting domain-containing protein [Acidobacteriota bacterium]
MKFAAVLKWAAVSAVVMAGQAQAALQTWRLEATANDQATNLDWIAPDFAAPGAKLVIDYEIEENTLKALGIFPGAVKSVTFNGEKSTASGYVLSSSLMLTSINIGSWAPRVNDEVSFLSLSTTNSTFTGNLHDTLLNVASNVSAGNAVLRLSFGDHTVFATPTSMTAVAAVPEPSTGALALLGLPALLAVVKRKKQKA